jgi:hypothetical protein
MSRVHGKPTETVVTHTPASSEKAGALGAPPKSAPPNSQHGDDRTGFIGTCEPRRNASPRAGRAEARVREHRFRMPHAADVTGRAEPPRGRRTPLGHPACR